MAPITLPPTFHNSFWSSDYRSGLETLFKQLDKGCIENKDIIAFIQSQAKAHSALASTLQNPPISPLAASSSGGASLQHTLLSLTGASSARGQAHETLSKELKDRVLAPFRAWAEAHETRVKRGREDELGKQGSIKGWESNSTDVAKLKQAYMAKMRAADDAEDDAKFAPSTMAPAVPSKLPSDIYTHSPKKASISSTTNDSPDTSKPLKRSGTVNDRISAKLRAASIHRLPPPPSEMDDDDDVREEAFIPPTHPGELPRIISQIPAKEKVIPGSPMPSSPPAPVLLSGLSLPQAALRSLLERLDHHLQTTPPPYTAGNEGNRTRSKTTILGTYNNTASGEEIVEWLVENVEGLGGDWERAEEAAASILGWGLMARIGVGRGFEPSGDSFYVLKLSNTNDSPLSASANSNFPSLLRSYLPSALSNSTDGEAPHLKARREAKKADEDYKNGVQRLEATRLALEERLEQGLRVWEKWEKERGGVVKTVLKQYEEAMAKLTPKLTELQKSTSLSIEAYHPDADIVALIEGNRTGPFRPHPHIYESLDQEHPNVAFGIDLRKWSGEQGWRTMVNAPQRPKGAIPDVLVALFQSLDEMYVDLPHDERRRSWIYEVPLVETHQLRAQLNDPARSVDELVGAIKKFNVPIVAGTLKLFLLELSPPVMGWEGWQDAKSIYPHIGADQSRDKKEDVSNVLGRLPSIQLYVLDALIGHLNKLIESTKSEEDNDLYITKLALSLGRTVLRPQYESELTIQDRTASLFFADLLQLYMDVLPPLVERKKQESERVMPTRKRTAIVDQRISRSSLTEGADPQELLGLQHAKQHPPRPATPERAAAIVEEQQQQQLTDNTAERPATPVTASPHVPVDLSSQDKVIGSGAASLSRAGSAETSRLRGPRGTRGPRPPPARVVSHTATPSQSSIETPAASSPTAVVSELDSTKSTPTRVADPNDYKPTKKHGTGAAGMFRARPGSVGAAIANFEKSKVEP